MVHGGPGKQGQQTGCTVEEICTYNLVAAFLLWGRDVCRFKYTVEEGNLLVVEYAGLDIFFNELRGLVSCQELLNVDDGSVSNDVSKAHHSCFCL